MSSPPASPSSRSIADAESQPLLLSSDEPTTYARPVPKPVISSASSAVAQAQAAEARQRENAVLPEASTVGRHVGWTSAVMLIFSRLIGSGVFATPGTILLSTGSPGMSLVFWVIGAVISFFGLAVYLELGTMLPRSGGSKVYLEYAFPRPRYLASTVFAVQNILLDFTASNCIIFGQYTLYALGIEPTTLNQRSLAVGALATICIIHSTSVRTGLHVQNFLGAAKLVLLIFLILTGLAILFRGHSPDSNTPPSELDWSHLFDNTETNPGLLATGIFKITYAYAGYHNINFVMNDVKDPIRTLKTAAPAALGLVSVSYVLINIAYFAVVPLEEIRNSGQLVAALFFTRVFGDVAGRIVLPGMIALSALGNVFVVVYTHSRVNQEIARQGFIPFSTLLATNKPFGAPMGGLLVHFIPSAIIIVGPPPGDVYAFILDVVGYPGQIIGLFVCIAFLKLRWQQPDLPRPFRAWGVAVWGTVVVHVVLILAPFFSDGKSDVSFWHGTYAVVGAGILSLAVIYWWLWTRGFAGLFGYSVEEKFETLDDGTTVTRLVRVPRGRIE